MVLEYQKIHPGVLLKHGYMNNNNLDSSSLASRLSGVTAEEIDRIVNGSASITAELSKKFGNLMETHEKYWLNVQQIYDKAMLESESEVQGNTADPDSCI